MSGLFDGVFDDEELEDEDEDEDDVEAEAEEVEDENCGDGVCEDDDGSTNVAMRKSASN